MNKYIKIKKHINNEEVPVEFSIVKAFITLEFIQKDFQNLKKIKVNSHLNTYLNS